MAVGRVIAQVTLDRVGGLPRDVVVNTYHFEGDDPATGSDRAAWDSLAPGLSSRLVTFYQAIQGYFSSSLAGTGTVDLYDWRDAVPRIPRYTTTFTHTKGTSALPNEVAVCLSMVAQPQPGAIARRRRGRVYIGPLHSGSAVSDGALTLSDAMPHLTMRTAIVNAAATMAHGSPGSFRLAIYSPTQFAESSASDGDAAWNDVKTLYMDDAFDIIRKRGKSPTSRFSVTLTG